MLLKLSHSTVRIKALVLSFLIFCFGMAIMTVKAIDQQPRISIFTPQGAVKGVRQVTARFTESMVAFGDPRLADPFDISCPQKGNGRWADTNNWVYDFQQDLPAGVACTFTLKSGVKSLSGTEITGNKKFEFNTGGPAITSSIPRDGNQSIDAEQFFIVGLDAPVKNDTVTRYARCEAEGIKEQIPVLIIDGIKREKILNEQQASQIYLLLFNKRSNRAAVGYINDNSMVSAANLQRAKSERILVLRCARRLPDDAQVKLIWDKGIETTTNLATTTPQTLSYKTRPAFTARFSCQRVNVKAQCIPVLPMNVSFTANVPTELAMKVRLRDANGKVYTPQKSDEQKSNVTSYLTFLGPFPEKTQFSLQMPADLVDDADRKLGNASGFPLKVSTDAYPPIVKFPADFGILEGKTKAVLPVTMRNVEAGKVAPEVKAAVEEARKGVINGKVVSLVNDEEIIQWITRFQVAQENKWETINDKSVMEYGGSKPIFNDKDKTRRITVPKPLGEKAFEVVGIPLPERAFHVVELASPRLGAALLGKKNNPFYARTSVLVTNLSTHVKIGRESSLAWVTTLDDAQPVNGADVVIRDCSGNVIGKGKTDSNGIAQLPGITKDESHCNYWPGGYFVSARTSQDMSFTLTSWSKGIEPWNFKVNYAWSKPRDPIHGVLDRTLLRVGETVHMKLIARKRTTKGFELSSPEDLPKRVFIEHEGSDTSHEVPVNFNAQNIAFIDWPIPKDAKLGTYKVRSKSNKEDWDALEIAEFRVEEFRLPTIRGQVSGPSKPMVNPKEVPINVAVSYLAGGGASGLPVKIRTQVEAANVSFANYDDFKFYGEDVKEGIQRNKESSYEYSESDEEGDYDATDENQPVNQSKNRVAETTPLTLDSAGTAKHVVMKLPKMTKPQSIVAEVEYNDANGERLTSANRIPIYPSALHVGLRSDSWAASAGGIRFQALALDLTGKPLPNRQVKVDMYTVQRYSHRRRLIGGFYAYEHVEETKRQGEVCKGVTDNKGILHCDAKTSLSGEVVLRAVAIDDAGNESASTTSVWIAGRDEWWFEVSDNDRMDVIPEAKQYENGQKARLQVRMPFRKATALVTVEREGIIDSYVMPISGKSPVIEVPIKANYSPNVYISVLAIRGRVEGVKPTALVDLGKPAFKLGVAEIKVGWQPHELKVSVLTPKEVYKVRDKVPVKISVKRADNGPLPATTDIAFAAVDEALLELKANDSWNLLEEMMKPRALEVATSTAQMQVVGRRHFGRKALPPGGGGGRQTARELFDTLLLWKGSVVLDSKGEAVIDVPLNDSMSAFKLVAIATGGADLFGTGSTSVRTSQDVMLFGGLPPLIREGDSYKALFVVRNTTDQKIPLTLHAALTSTNIDGQHTSKPLNLPVLSASLAPNESREMAWEVKVPYDIGKLSWDITVNDAKGQSTDRLKLSQKVVPAYPVQVYQATLFQLDSTKSMSVQIPADAIPGRGGISVAPRATLVDDLSGVREYMARYPFTCLEQQASVAVSLADKNAWSKTMASLPNYLDRDGLAKYFASDWLLGSDVLTAYLLSIAHENNWQIPENTRVKMLKGLSAFVNGKVLRYSDLSVADLTIRKLAAIEALSRYNMADKNLITSFNIAPNLWPTSAVLDWFNILKRVSDIPEREARLAEAQQILRSRLNFQGTIMTFSTQRDDALWWLMVSTDVNANRALLTFLDEEGWKEDMPRMARGALERRLKGHWNTTVANAWGTIAMQKFADKFESIPITGKLEASLSGKKAIHDWSVKNGDATLNFAWPSAKDSLSMSQQGNGKPWVTVTSHAAIPLKAPLSTGYRVERTVTAIEQKISGAWSRGDVVKVKLSIDAQSDMTWVVVSDPIPAGAAVLGSGLGGDSKLLTKGQRRSGYAWPAFEEKKFDGFRAYYAYVPKGKFSVEYTLRLNNPGVFIMPSTRVEAMYAPEMFGEVPNQPILVKP